jgi:hypothetical protein
MDFGWTGKAFWIISVIVILAGVLYSKRNRVDDPTDKSE